MEMEQAMWEVHPGVGMGELRFGASREEVKLFLGPPEEEVEEPLNDDRVIAWHYWSQGLSAHFSRSEGYRLESLQVDNPRLTLQGRGYIGLSEDELLAIVEGQDWGTVEVDEDESLVTVMVWDLGVTFIVPEEEGVVTSIQLAPLLDADENTIWPRV